MTIDEQYMSRCLQLAELGKGKVAPNPMVGAVIVYDDKIIGEGYHKAYGEAHAEVNAIASVENKELLSEATIYVSLEPCAHFGKTPPCADLIIEKQFKRVVIGSQDSHDQVDGLGVERIKKAGIEISLAVLEKECRSLNKHFFTQHEKKRPYVLLKWAQSSNGLIDSSSGTDGEVTWISAPETQSMVHQLRSEYQAILVGRKTIQSDNPSLTVRAVKGNNPIRVIIDSSGTLEESNSAYDNQADTIVITRINKNSKEGIKYIQLDEINAKSILEVLHKQGIQSVLIEGGQYTLQSFIDANLWDEAKIITGKSSIISGTKAPIIQSKKITSKQFFGDVIHTFKNE